MSKKYKLNLSPSRTISLSIPNFRMGIAGIIDLANMLMPLLWGIFILFLFSASFFYDIDDTGHSNLIWLYGFVVVLLGFQLLKRIVGKGDFLPVVSYDILLLSFTSIIAVSLFASVVSSKGSFSIWGGVDLRAISGLSMIAFWFLYYLSNVIVNSQDRFRRTLTSLSLSPIILVVLNVTFGNDYSYGMAVPMIALAPFWLTMLVMYKHDRILNLINLIVALAVLNRFISGIPMFSMMVVSLSEVLLLVLLNFKNIKQLLADYLVDLKKFAKAKMGLVDFVNSQQEVNLVILLLIMFVLSLVWIISNPGQPLFQSFNIGLDGLKAYTLGDLVLGKGLIVKGGSLVTQFISSYGLLSGLLFLVILIIVFKDLVKSLINRKSAVNKGIVMGVISFLFVSLSVFALSLSSDLHIILFWLFVSFAGVSKSLNSSNKDSIESRAVNDFAGIASPGYRRIFTLLQHFLVIVIILFSFYALSLLRSISFYIS